MCGAIHKMWLFDQIDCVYLIGFNSFLVILH